MYRGVAAGLGLAGWLMAGPAFASMIRRGAYPQARLRF